MFNLFEVFLCIFDFWLFYFILSQFLDQRETSIVKQAIVIVSAGICLYAINQIVFSYSLNSALNTLAVAILLYAEVRLLLRYSGFMEFFWLITTAVLAVVAEFIAMILILQISGMSYTKIRYNKFRKLKKPR